MLTHPLCVLIANLYMCNNAPRDWLHLTTVMSQRDTVCNEIFSLLVIIKKWSDYSCAVLYNVLQLTLVTGKKKKPWKKPAGVTQCSLYHCIPQDGQKAGYWLCGAHLLSHVPSLKEKKREREKRESKPIYNLSLSLPWWLDDGWLHPL